MAGARQTWTDERLDDLNKRVDAGFDRLIARMDAGFEQLTLRIDAMHRMMVVGFVSIFASVIGASIVG